MPVTNFPNGVSSFGVPVLGGLSTIPFGKVLFVQSSHSLASDNNTGEDKDRPMRTIDAAIARCAANAGDFIIVGPGHIESIVAAGGLAIDVAGISLVGVGHGSNRPIIQFSTSTAADMNIDAANTRMDNFLFISQLDAMVAPVDVNAADVMLTNIETRDASATQAGDFINCDATCDRFRINGWRHRGDAAAGAACAIRLIGGTDAELDWFDLDGNFSAGAILNITTVAANLRIGARSFGNVLRTRNAADILIGMGAGSTGFIDNILGRLQDDAANITEAFAAWQGIYGNNLYLANANGERVMQFNATASTDA